ncbi:hypothetical protein KDW61_26360 [Burkholderia cenocepacia]|nr:hypothetical protein [Burkholderia cenocepacia]
MSELVEHVGQRPSHRPNTDLVADALDFQLDIAAFIGKVGRNLHGLRAAIPNTLVVRMSFSHVWMYRR